MGTRASAGDEFERKHMDALGRLASANAIDRLRGRDATLFADDAEGIELAANSMGWTDIATCCEPLPEFRKRTISALGESLTDIVVLGMGGSSLATLVIGEVLASEYSRRLHVLDTTAPRTVAAALADLDPTRTLYLVSSKSGGTIEPLSLYAIFRDEADERLGREAAGDRFIAITDPSTSLETLAVAEGFHAVFHGMPDVGGRFSALTAFGLVPATLLGIDVERMAARATEMETECALPIAFNPAAVLAAFVADNHSAGRDKLTVVASPALSSIGLWIEQLVAESLGKEGTGVVPVVELSDDLPTGYGPDRAIVVVRLKSDARLAEWIPRLSKMAPVHEIVLDDIYDVAGEFVRWEHAVALLGVLLGVNPFGQPNVAAAKAATSAVLSGEVAGIAADTTTPDGTAITFAGALAAPGHEDTNVSNAIGHALAQLGDGDFLGILAYLPEDEEQLAPLEKAVPRVAAALGVAVTLEVGPRYLHSTGQLHKGGANNGVFLLVTTRDHADICIPGRDWTLRDLHAAQADGDLATLVAAGRRVLRIDLPCAEHVTIVELARYLENAAGVVSED